MWLTIARGECMPIRFRCPRQDCEQNSCPAKQVFSCLSSEQDARLGRERLARRYDAGQVVVHLDTPALAVLSIHSGRVQLVRQSGGDAHKVVVGTRGPGDLLGVREVLSAMPYQVTVETLEPSVLCSVPREAFLDVVRDCPELAMRLLKTLARDFLVTEEQLAGRAHLSVAARTARLLVALVDGHRPAATAEAPAVSMSREEMALLVGTTRETISRSLHRLSEQGAVKLENGSIHIVDDAMLERISEL